MDRVEGHFRFRYQRGTQKYLKQSGHAVEDCGTSSEERCDYSDFGAKAAKMVADGKAERAILVCGSGFGMCMVANRFKKVRAAVLRNENDATLSRRHNDANVACLGSRITDAKTANVVIDIFLKTQFEGGRHKPRVEKIDRV